MPRRSWRQRIEDILQQVDFVLEDAADSDWESFADNRVLQGDVMYRIGIIGEAVSTLPDEFKARHGEIPWRQIRNMRNVLTHVYFKVDLERVWKVIQEDLQPLRRQMRALLAAEDAAADDAGSDQG